MKEIVGIITKDGRVPVAPCEEPKKNNTKVMYTFPSEYVDLFIEVFLHINGFKFRSLRNYASRVKVLRCECQRISLPRDSELVYQ
ncbi:hypothetical protein SDC9_45775 [bioreactor metagenome]|uniref:Uncharacterized protein n=1 Tax=bioreactor metagenome TaxID=1076179 RepID=A0A644W7N1_9ZZZZ